MPLAQSLTGKIKSAAGLGSVWRLVALAQLIVYPPSSFLGGCVSELPAFPPGSGLGGSPASCPEVPSC